MSNAVSSAKTAVVDWYNGLDFSVFQKGWEKADSFIGNAYSTVVSIDYLSTVNNTLNQLKATVNNAYDSARDIAQEALSTTKTWAVQTLSIDSSANNINLNYHQTALEAAKSQAQAIIEKYHEYASSAKLNMQKPPLSLLDYLNNLKYDNNTMGILLASAYAGQPLIIGEEFLAEAVSFLSGKTDALSALLKDSSSPSIKVLSEILAKLKNRIESPDTTKSLPLTHEELQAVAELSQTDCFKPEDFGVTLSQVLTPKYVLKQAMGAGLNTAAIKTILTVAPDIVSVIIKSVKDGHIDSAALEKTGIEGAVAMSEGFVEGGISNIVMSLSKQGKLGEGLKNVSGDVIATFVFLIIEGMIAGQSLAKGEITPEEFGCFMADNVMTSVLSIPTSKIVCSVLPNAEICYIIGEVVGNMISEKGYYVAKEYVLKFIDAGGFEAIVPETAKKGFKILKEKVASLNMHEQVTNLKDFAITSLSNGIIKIIGVTS